MSFANRAASYVARIVAIDPFITDITVPAVKRMVVGHESMGRESGDSRRHAGHNGDSCAARSPESKCQDRPQSQDHSGGSLLVLAWVGFFVPLIWVTSPAFSFAEYSLSTGPLVAGALCLAAGLWLFSRSHADLGTNWSITLEVRKEHRLITQGVYRAIRHPMYSALALYTVGQALVIANWVAGLSNVIAFAVLLALRIGAEERMMAEQFGAEYAAYSARTKRLIPGVW
jgi:protein-S-isoprenylcysteine O-methyltransferase Ste14